MKAKKMKNWMPIRGNFVERSKSIVFKGMLQPSSDEKVKNPFLLQTTPDGIVLYEDMVSNGFIEATVKFENFDKDDFAQIVFNYQNDNWFMCAGVANAIHKYGFNYINGQQSNTIYATGVMEELSISEFHIRVHLIGSTLELYINNIKVLTSVIPFLLNCTQVGIWVKSKGEVFINDFRTSNKPPEAFIVSQFGDYYDILYNEVIKPVCEELNYNPVRGDEVASCSLVLNDIITSIRNSTVVIADITPDNPNVFYEVGYAHALTKPTILLCEKRLRDKLPFDVSGFRTIYYDDSIGGKRIVKERLKDHLQHISQVWQ